MIIQIYIYTFSNINISLKYCRLWNIAMWIKELWSCGATNRIAFRMMFRCKTKRKLIKLCSVGIEMLAWLCSERREVLFFYGLANETMKKQKTREYNKQQSTRKQNCLYICSEWNFICQFIMRSYILTNRKNMYVHVMMYEEELFDNHKHLIIQLIIVGQISCFYCLQFG